MKKKKDIEEVKQELEKKPSKFRKWFVRIVLFLLLFIVFTIGGAFVSLQFKSVRTIILDFAEGEINKSLNAKLNIEDFTLTSLKSIDLYGTTLVVGGDTVIAIPEASAFVDIDAIMNGTIAVNSLTTTNAKINMLKDSAGIWNISKIPKPSADTTAPSDTKLLFKKVQFVNADFKMFDPYAEIKDSTGFNTNNMHLEKLNFSGAISIRPAKKKLVASLEGLSFYESVMNRTLTPTDLDFLIDGDILKISDLVYKSGETTLDLDAEIVGIDVFGGIKDGDVETAKVDVSAKATNVNVPELMSLLNVPVDFKGTHDFTLEADGTMDNINIESFELELDNSTMKVKGKILNVLDSDKIYFNLQADDSYLTYFDVVKFLNLNKSNLPDFKYANLRKLRMKGNPKYLEFDLNFNSGLGSLMGDLVVDNRGTMGLKYDGEIKSIDISAMYPNTIKTNLNGELHAEMKGIKSKSPFIDLRFDGGANSIDKYKMSRLKIKMESDNFKLVRLDTLYAEFGTSTMGYTVGEPEKRYIQGFGLLDISNKDTASYNLDLVFNAMNLKELLGSEKMPSYLSGRSLLNGKGQEINEISGEFDTDINDIVFDDRAFFPFGFNLKVDRFSPKDRKIEFDSDFGNIIFQGDFNFNNTMASLQNQGNYMYNFIAKELNKLIPSDQEVVDKLELVEVEKLGAFDTIDVNLKINVNDFSFLTAFMDSTNLKMKTELNFHIFSQGEESSLYINSLNINDLYYNKGDLTITSHGLNAEGGLYMKLKDSMAVFSDFNLKTKANEQISINDNTLNYPSLNLDFDGEQFEFNGITDLNNEIDVRFTGNTTLIPGGVQLGFDTLDLSYLNEYNLSLTQPIKAKFVNGGFIIESMELTNPNTKERISLSGEYNADTERFNNFSLTLNSLDLQTLKTFVPRQNKKQFDQMNGMIDSMTIVMNGTVSEPLMELNIVSDDLQVNEQMVGDIKADLSYKSQQITGNLLIDHYSNDESMPNLIKGEINSLPINLSLTDVENRFYSNKETDMEFVIDSLPLSIISPFVPSISYLKGIGKGKLLVGGSLPDNLTFDGIVRFDNTSFLVDATNVGYRARGGLILKENKVFLEDVYVYNQPDDLSNGKAKVTGVINLEKMDIERFDLGIRTDRFLVMNDETQKAKPDLYGRTIIATETDSLRFYGSFTEPNLEGYVAIESADLKMPDEEDIQLVRSKFIYKRVGDLITASYGRADSVKVKKTKKAQEVTDSFMDLLNIDLDLEFRGRTLVEMQINQFLRTSVIIGTPINMRSIRYVKRPYSKEAKLYGKIVLKEGSKLSFFKTFDITGDINFPTGNISNPTLDLKAEYQGTTAEYKKYTVEIFVTGTKENPILRFEFEIGGESGYGEREKKLSDIINLLLTGRISNDNTANGSGQDINIQSTVASDILTRQVAQELGKLGLSAQIDFEDNFENAKVKIGGDIVGGARWSFGGNVNDISGSRLEIEIPLDDFINLTEEAWLNIILNFTYVNSPETVKTDENQIHWEGKLKLGGSW